MQVLRELVKPSASAITPSLVSRGQPADVGRLAPNVAGPTFGSDDGRLVEWTLGKVMHGLPSELTPICLSFHPIRETRAYELHYFAYADNLVQPLEGVLKIATKGTTVAFQPPHLSE